MIHIFLYVLFIDGVHVLLRHEYDTYISICTVYRWCTCFVKA